MAESLQEKNICTGYALLLFGFKSLFSLGVFSIHPVLPFVASSAGLMSPASGGTKRTMNTVQNEQVYYEAEPTQQYEPFEKGGMVMDTTRNYLMPAIIMTVGLFILGIMAYIQAGRFIKSQAVDGCFQTARLDFTNERQERVSTPENYWYDLCMEKKGYGEDER